MNLQPKGNAVTIIGLGISPEDLTEVQVNASREISGSRRLAAQNPVWIVSGWKEE